MSRFVLYFASGDSLYGGATLIVLAVVISPYGKQNWLVRLRNLAAWLGLAFIVMASPPSPWTVSALFVIVFLTWLTSANRWLGLGATVWRVCSTVAVVVLLAALTLLELPHRKIPTIVGTPCDHLTVVGDSMSSGIDPNVLAWPAVMQQLTGVPVKNLSRPGAQTAEGPEIAAKVTPDDCVVLVEIGGNDLFSN